MKNQNGFSLTEILVAVALMGGITVVTMKMMETQKGNEAYIKARSDIQSAISLVKATLSDPENCRNALAGQALQSSGSTITTIRIPLKKHAGEYKNILRLPPTTGPEAGDDDHLSYRVESITLIQPASAPENLANLEVRFRLKNLSLSQWGAKNEVTSQDGFITEIIPLVVTKNTNILTDCGPVVSESNIVAKQKFCISMGLLADWDSATGKCVFKDMLCPMGQVLTSIGTTGKQCESILDHVNLDDLFNTSTSCSYTGNFRIINDGGKLRIDCY